MANVNVGFEPAVSPWLLMPERFDAMIARLGQRIAWRRGHACPCTFSGAGPQGALPLTGTARRSCNTCFGSGAYWDDPSAIFIGWISYIQLSPTPDEPGVRTDAAYGAVQLSEPSLTIPYQNPNLAVTDPGQPTDVWNNASLDDIFIPVDMLSRYTAVLQVGGQQNLPFQQNLQIEPAGAVTVWNVDTGAVEKVANYAVSGPTVTINGYPDRTSYMVEFQAAPVYVAYRPAGGLPHVRPLGGGTVKEPRRFKLATLDFWTRQRGIEPSAQASTVTAGAVKPYVPVFGSAVIAP